MAKQRFEGACHCGLVRFTVEGDLDQATVCNCSICTKKGFVHLIVGPESFQLLAGAEVLTTYEFNTKLAKHRFCKVCGVHPFYTPRSDPDKVDVNVRCLASVDVEGLEPKRFNGRHWEEAIEGRLPWR